MEQLLTVLNNNFTVGYCGSYVNELQQPVEHITICDKAYSIRQQDTNSFEVLSSEVVAPNNAPYPYNYGYTSSVAWHTESNLTADEVVGYFAEKSQEYLKTLMASPLYVNHVIAI